MQLKVYVSTTIPRQFIWSCWSLIKSDALAGAEGINMSSPLTAGLEESMDMALPSMDLPSMLLEPTNPQQGSSLVASSSAPLLGGSAHGSVEIESQLSGLAAAGMRDFLSASAPDVADVAQFLCGDEDAAAAADGRARQLVDSSASLASLSSARGSALSMASDTSVVYIGAPSSQPLQPSLPGSPGLCGANTPEVGTSSSNIQNPHFEL